MTSCINPFKYFMDFVDYELSQDSTKTFLDILNNPNIFEYSSNMCCPTCGTANNENPYVLSGNFDESDSKSFFSLFLDSNNDSHSCCLNGYITTDIYNLIKEKVGDDDNNITFCCNKSDFKKSVVDLKKLLNSSTFNNYLLNYDELLTGLIEWNTVNGDTLLNSIVEVLKDKPDNIALEYIFNILDNGLVIACNDEGVVITSIESYVTYFVDTTP